MAALHPSCCVEKTVLSRDRKHVAPAGASGPLAFLRTLAVPVVLPEAPGKHVAPASSCLPFLPTSPRAPFHFSQAQSCWAVCKVTKKHLESMTPYEAEARGQEFKARLGDLVTRAAGVVPQVDPQHHTHTDPYVPTPTKH